MIELDVSERRLTLDVPEAELQARAPAAPPDHLLGARGYLKLFLEHVLQADEGADFDFLVGGSGYAVPRRSF